MSQRERRLHPARPQPSRGSSRPPVQPRAQSWISAGAAPAIPAVAILPLRVFLGITFLYAGFQKLADPGYFTLGSTTYIGTQMLQFSRTSPIKFLFTPMLAHAVAFGWLTIFTEFAIGALVLVGLFTRPAAVVGFILNFILFLSASWGVYPYVLGSDIVWCICWLTLALTGPGPFALDPMVGVPLARRLPLRLPDYVLGSYGTIDAGPQGVAGSNPTLQAGASGSLSARRRTVVSRREALVGGAVALLTVVLGLIPRGRPSGAVANSAAPTPGPAGGNSAATPTPGSGSSSGGQLLAHAGQIPPNGSLPFNDPSSGDPAVLVHAANSNYYAYSAVCTHAGCQVLYDSSSKLLVCPCHGGAYDPTQGAQVVAGPPPSPLPSLPIKIDSSGNVYLG